MMSVFLTEELERHTARIENANLVFLFCSAQDEKRNTAIAVLRGLVRQIIVKRQQLVKHALPYFETPERTQQTLGSLETLWLIFSKLIADAGLGKMFCVLDGLDECETNGLRTFLQKITGVFGSTSSSTNGSMFKLLVSSRVKPGLQRVARVQLDLDTNDRVADAIERFIVAQIEELTELVGLTEGVRTVVREVLLKRAEGTFLWVGFAMHELRKKQTCSQVLEALDDLPNGLPAIYSLMLSQVPKEKRQESSAILRWVTLAVRPLELRELAAATELRHSSSITMEHAMHDAIILCGPLLKVQGCKVSLVHQSARDYLLREREESDTALEAFRVNFEEAHLELAKKCLDCLTQSDLQRSVVRLNSEPRPSESPLLRYSIQCWPEHARSCSLLAAQLLHSNGCFIKKDSDLRKNWWASYEEGLYGPVTPPLLHMACFLDIRPWIKVLAKARWWLQMRRRFQMRQRLQKRQQSQMRQRPQRCQWSYNDINSKDGDGKTGLHWAAERANEAAVKLLVSKGADLNVKDRLGQTALHKAALWGHEATVQILIDSGAVKWSMDNYQEVALHKAAWGGHLAVAQLLIDGNAYDGATDNRGQTALHKASWGGHEKVVKLLVDQGANINDKDIYGQMALHKAAWRGHLAVVQLLVSLRANVEEKDNAGRTALQLAMATGKRNEEVVRVLADRVSNVQVAQDWLEDWRDLSGGWGLRSAESGLPITPSAHEQSLSTEECGDWSEEWRDLSGGWGLRSAESGLPITPSAHEQSLSTQLPDRPRSTSFAG